MSKTLRIGNESSTKEKVEDSFLDGTGAEQLKFLAAKGIKCYPDRPLSFSSFKQFNKSPKDYLKYVQESGFSSSAMKLGSAFEERLLMPVESWKSPVTKGMADTIADMIIEARKDDFMNIWLDIPMKAYQHTKNGKIKSLEFVSQPDVLILSKIRYAVDIKTIYDVEIARDRICAPEFGYWIQAAVYSLVHRLRAFHFWFIQTKAPHRIEVITLNYKQLAYLHEQLYIIIDRFKTCLEKDFYERFDPVVIDPEKLFI